MVFRQPIEGEVEIEKDALALAAELAQVFEVDGEGAVALLGASVADQINQQSWQTMLSKGRRIQQKPCPLYSRKRTCAVQRGMSALGQ